KGYASAAAYALERENIAVPDSTGLTRQSGSQRSRGFEFELSAAATDNVSVRATYSFNSAVLDRAGNVPAFAPRHMASVWVTTKLADGFSVGAGVRCLSDQFVAADNRNTISAYGVL